MTMILIIGILLILFAISILITSFIIARRNRFNEGQMTGLVLITITLTLIFGVYGLILTNKALEIILTP